MAAGVEAALQDVAKLYEFAGSSLARGLALVQTGPVMIGRNLWRGCIVVAVGAAVTACANGDGPLDDEPQSASHADAGADTRADHAAPGIGSGDDRDADDGDAANNLVDGGIDGDAANNLVDGGIDASSSADDASAADSGAPPPAVDASPALDASVPDASAPLDATTDVDVPDTSTAADVGVPPVDSGACSPTVALLVNEVQSDGATAGDEFVEIFNPNDCTVSLAGWSLRYSSAGASTPATKWTGASGDNVPSHGYVVIKGGGFTGSNNQVIGSFVGSSGVLAKAAGAVGLHNPSGNLVDGVAYGSAPNNLEGRGSPAPELSSSHSDARSSTSADTGNNAADFSLTMTPTPGAHN